MAHKTILAAVFLVVAAGSAMADYVWVPGRWKPPHWMPPRWTPGHWVYRTPPYPGPPEWWWHCWPIYDDYGEYRGVRCRMQEP